MDLWIRSQDRKKLVKSGYLTLFLSDTTWFIYSDTTTGEPFEIGKYKTKERALEVLDEIQDLFITKEALITEFTKDGLTMMNKQPSSVVYEMPEE